MQRKEVLYNLIGDNYNATRVSDPYIAEIIYSSIINNPKGIYLDIGCGTGNYTIAIADKGLNMYGIDPSEKMIATASQRNNQINWMLGSAEEIPVEDNFFDGLFGTLTLHHWQNLEIAFKELFRILKPGSKLVFFTSTPQQMEEYWLNHYFPKMMQNSIEIMPSEGVLQKAAINAGFIINEPKIYSVQDDLKDHFLYVGKNNPEIYFNDAVQNGISSFRAFSNAEEVKKGLEQLQNDIASEKFTIIKQKYKTERGDYLFFKAVKPENK